MTLPDTLMARIAARYPLADGIVGFDLLAADGTPLPAFTAGAHIDVHTPGGPVRPYSLWGPPAEGRYRIAVQLEPTGRGGSAAMHVHAHEGTLLRIGHPRNQFLLVETSPRSLLLAGGIGITPLLAMAHRLHELGAGFALHHATRTVARAAFAQALRDSTFAERVHHHHDDQPDTALNIVQVLRNSPPGTHLYVCGPQGFMDAVLSEARRQGWAEERLHREYFSAPGLSPSVAPGTSMSFSGPPGAGATTAASAAPAHPDRAFQVQLARTQRIIPVAAGQTLVDALAAHGVHIPVSCEQGLCGTCETRVLEGEIDHRDFHLSPKEQALNDRLLACCSRARSDTLVLDL